MKCVIWDLDNTLWRGVLMEGDDIELAPGVERMLAELDRRGILHSVASRNDHDLAFEALQRLRVADYFLVPQISWDSKSALVLRIADKLNLGLDSFVFIDDDPFERAEVAAALPAVRCRDPSVVGRFERHALFSVPVVTPDAAQRRDLYRAEERRSQSEQDSGMARAEFLRSLDLRFTVRRPTEDDLSRCHELTVRTHQLNTTGIVFSEEKLRALLASGSHSIAVASLSDRFGSYGLIGLAVVATEPDAWSLELLLTSCRVVSRGAGSLLLRAVMQQAFDAGVRLFAELVPSERNRGMLVALRFAGFAETGSRGRHGGRLLEARLGARPTFPTTSVRGLTSQGLHEP